MAITLVEENGTGLSTANTYNDMTDLDAYMTENGHTQWFGINLEVRKAAAIRAANYMDKRWGRKYRGRRLLEDQRLGWPRMNAKDDDGYFWTNEVPRQVKWAHAEYALRAAIFGALAPDPIHAVPAQTFADGAPARAETTNSGKVLTEKVKVGPLEETVTYQSARQPMATFPATMTSAVLSTSSLPEIPEADMLMEQVIVSGQTMLERC